MLFALLSLGASFHIFGTKKSCAKCKESVYKYIEYAKNETNQEKLNAATKKISSQISKKEKCVKKTLRDFLKSLRRQAQVEFANYSVSASVLESHSQSQFTAMQLMAVHHSQQKHNQSGAFHGSFN